jgi:hypothetical protein
MKCAELQHNSTLYVTSKPDPKSPNNGPNKSAARNPDTNIKEQHCLFGSSRSLRILPERERERETSP